MTRPERSRRWSLAVGVGLLLAVVVAIALRGATSHAGTLDPDNPDPEGAQALARVLDEQGVDLTVARSADELDDTDVSGATVVVTSTDHLGSSTIDRLLAHTDGVRVVLVEPGPRTVEELGLEGLPYRTALDDPVAALCSPYGGLELAVDRAASYPGPDGCFPTDDGSLLVEPQPDLQLLGAGDALRNDQVLRGDNAAVALRLLGSADRLVWYVPSLDDLGGSDGVSLRSLLPRWLGPALLLLLMTAVGLLLWRVRRLGPLATEPLPVAVKAIETTRSRGRLYRKAGDRGHAAAALRTAARSRAAEQLGLGTGPDPDALVDGVARHTGRPVAEVAALLGAGAPPPATDHDLITLADALAELDREVRRP